MGLSLFRYAKSRNGFLRELDGLGIRAQHIRYSKQISLSESSSEGMGSRILENRAASSSQHVNLGVEATILVPDRSRLGKKH
jgi:hypothetical protein